MTSECRLPEKLTHAWGFTSPKEGNSPLHVDSSLGELGPVCADTSYCSRRNAHSVVELAGRPFLKPRKNATPLAKGHPGWRRMILHYRRKRSGFERVCHERSNGEATNSSFKRLWGSRLYSKKRWNQ